MKPRRGQRIRPPTVASAWLLLALLLPRAAAAGDAPAAPRPSVSQFPAFLVPERKSPVAQFRELLLLNPRERSEALKARPPEVRQRLLAKLAEYQALPPDERECRLQATELRYFLLPLLQLPATNRTAQLQFIPEPPRSLVAERLQHWQMLPPSMQDEFLANEAAIAYWTQLQATTNRVPPDPHPKLAADLARWRELPAEKQQRMLAQFNQFFELKPREKAKALAQLSQAERAAMSRTVQKFESLPPAQREKCLQGFNQFAGLNETERLQFLRNAEQWKTMTPAERQAWRELVDRLQRLPPLPPAFSRPTPGSTGGSAAAPKTPPATNL